MADLIAPVATCKGGDIAAALIDEFGTLPAVLSADHAHWTRITQDGDVSAFLGTVRESLCHALHVEAREQPLLHSLKSVSDYLKADMSWRRRERFRVLHLDIRHRLIHDELVSEGTIDRSSVYVREVIRRALEIGSASLILAHNHPSGDPTPSTADIQMTRAIERGARLFGIAVFDHIIVAKNAMTSMRTGGLL